MRAALRTLRPFRSLDDPALATIERHAQQLRLPPRRWLLRRGHRLTRELFLLQGTLTARRDHGFEQLRADALAGESLNAWAAGATEITTATVALLISIAPEAIRALPGESRRGDPEVDRVDDWMDALLRGPVMRWFSPGAWARVLRAGRLRDATQGERIVRRGELCDSVFVVAEGVVESGSERLGPGDFFGDESTLGRRPAASDARMITAGRLVCFTRANLVALAADYVPPRIEPPPRRIDLDDLSPECEDQALTTLRNDRAIAVRGTDPARRLMVATRLMRRGFHVV